VDVAGVEVDAVRGPPEDVAPQTLKAGSLLAFVGEQVGADERRGGAVEGFVPDADCGGDRGMKRSGQQRL
jgi:hypothetical protein